MKFVIAILLPVLFLVVPDTYAGTQSFSAEAIQSAPGMQTTRMKLYVSGDKSVRIEMFTPQGEIVQQYIASSGMMRVLYPDRKEYLEQKSPVPLVMPGAVVQNPCDNMPDTKCEKVGEEKVNGQQAMHWKITRPGPNQQQFIIEQWLDKERGITLREQLPNGVSINASMVGKEKINGREAERWEVVMTRADGKKQSGTRWYDTELGITVREAFPNGSVRELRNIKVKEPDTNLFMLPKDYRKLEVPVQPQRR
ncbi:hypothetical protein BMS3Bbin11_00250 [bacterium BMS3Bbin11]|nr:hypothetical protein BMS3Abin11_02102 [bacterium BMS3Abin11]GBE45170.1 hypothetical protein BMS3Bbin11_00250 [bacterium BMS3Bbin11]GMT39480.1 MAG: hypothetical protein IEMM0001_0215 [bacterium]HDH16960.1 hypothetical protein [Gammaproteobacteria bacterium]HDZ78929.1 hypothetical protein [Gammaproteobacteria bacterium]